MSATRTRASSHAACGVLDQILSSGTNVLTALVASAVLGPTAFAAFVVAYAVVTILLAVGRAVVGDPVLAYLPTVSRGERRAVTRSAFGAALALGVLGAGIAVATGLAVPALATLLWLAPWIPVAMLQDAGRFAFVARGRAGSALGSDVAWAVIQVAGLVVVGFAGSYSPATLAATWGAGALAGLAVIVAAGRDEVRPSRPGDWVRRTRHLSGWFTVTSILGQCEVYAVLVLAGFLLAPVDAAGLRVVQLLVFAPTIMLVSAMIMLVTPAVARAVAHGDVTRVRAARRAALVGAGVLVAGVVGVVLLRGPLLALIFPRYTAFAPLVVPVAVQTACYVAAAPFIAVLRGFHQARLLAALHGALSVGLIVAGALAMPSGVLALGWTLAAVTATVVLAMIVASPAPRRAVAGHRVRDRRLRGRAVVVGRPA